MLPPGHLVVGYVLYSLSVRVRGSSPPSGIAALATAFGTQLPDLVDKPLAWTFDVLPAGRSLAHSGFVAISLVVVLFVLASLWRPTRVEAVGGFAIGYLSHLVADAYRPLIQGRYEHASFLAWPFLDYSDPGGAESILVKLSSVDLSSQIVHVEIVIVVLGVLLWVADGTPGVGEVQRAFSITKARLVRDS